MGNRSGQSAYGWVVFSHDLPLDDGVAVEHLCRKLEDVRGYDAGTLLILGFRRLEESQSK